MPNDQSPLLRPALADLPIRPLNQRPKTSKTSPVDVPKIPAGTLTPPCTPQKPDKICSAIDTDDIEARPTPSTSQDQLPSTKPISELVENQPTNRQDAVLKLFTEKYRLHEVLGQGVWCTVYRAIEEFQPTTSEVFPFSPPTSPIDGSLPNAKRVLAVKKPHRQHAYRIVEREARILSSLHSDDQTSSYLVPFHGFDVTQNSIVLDAVPLTLEAFARSAREHTFSTKTMFDPIVGAKQWVELAEHLISGLAFLHSKGCVHGDIKPANILLRQDIDDRFTPLFCDFSSSRIIADLGSLGVEEVSAVTPEYTSPELFEALRKDNKGKAVITCASDVFALAVVMLFAAIGENPYACAHLDAQKQMMAKEGMPLEFARRGGQASRIMPGRAVDRIIKGPLMKDAEKRSDVNDFKSKIQEVAESWRNGGWLRGG